MSAFAEFLLVAAALYVWESALWLPLRAMALRRRGSGGKWKALDPGNLIATRVAGMVPMLPFPPDAGLAPCQGPPLLANADGEFLMETAAGAWMRIGQLRWEDIAEKERHLMIAGTRIRLSSPRPIGFLRNAKFHGATPEAAVARSWRLALSPARAGREWRRWKLVSASLRWNGPLLTLGFFAGLPLSHIYLSGLSTGLLAVWLWFLMVWTAAHLWWLGKRVYPDARSALRMDALLSLFVPFHAMRALEIAAAHAVGTTHPAGLILSSGDLENPWLGRFVRGILHPLPSSLESPVLLPLITAALSRRGAKPEDFDQPPDCSDDPQAAAYCPRCHAIFIAGIDTCPDCQGLTLRRFE